MLLRIIDLETTGLDLARGAEVCEIAFIDLDEHGVELARFQSLVKPFGAIPPEARAVHHIGDDGYWRAAL